LVLGIIFPNLNQGYNQTFRPNHLSIGVVAPIENVSQSALPSMDNHLELAKTAERLGFSSLWLRDVPFHVPSFGDAGQLLDPFVYLGFLAAHTSRISLGVASIVLPLRHPVHIAKSAASIDVLSNGRLILGVASGDRPSEYPAMNVAFKDRGERFRESFEYIQCLANSYPHITGQHGSLNGDIDLLPKPTAGQIPMLLTGASQQDPYWLAENGHGWITYPRDISTQSQIIQSWRDKMKQTNQIDKPAVQSLYIDLLAHPNAQPQPIHLGFRSGVNYLIEYLKSLEKIGINHVALNLRFNQADIEETMNTLAEEVLPEFNKFSPQLQG